MAYKLSISDKQFNKWLEKVPLSDEKKTTWTDSLQQSGITEELVTDMQTAVSELEGSDRTRYLAELTLLIKQWRLAEQTKHFRRR